MTSSNDRGHTPDSPGTEQSGFKVGICAGTLLKDRYLVEKQLGQGGIGIVFLARDTQLLSRPVVIKVLQDSWTGDTWMKNKFNQEIESLARINHPGVVGVVDYGELGDGQPFIVMQYVEGNTLEAELKHSSPLSVDRTANLLRQMCYALSAAHSKGVIHRDLKPQNIMIQKFENEEVVKIIDFGIAKVKDSRLATSTKESITAGTLLYMAPEHLKSRQCSAASDTWAVGVIAYEMLTGRLPFTADSEVDLYQLQQKGLINKPSELRSDLPLSVDKVLMKVLSFDPADRPSKASDFADEFSSAVSSKVRSAEFDSEPTRLHSGEPASPTQPRNLASVVSESATGTAFLRSVSSKRLIFYFTVVLIFAGIVWILAGSNSSDQGGSKGPQNPASPPPPITQTQPSTQSTSSNASDQGPQTQPSPTNNGNLPAIQSVPHEAKDVEPKWLRNLPPNDVGSEDIGVFVIDEEGSPDETTADILSAVLSETGHINILDTTFLTSGSFKRAFAGQMPERQCDQISNHLDHLIVVTKKVEFSPTGMEGTPNMIKATASLEVKMMGPTPGTLRTIGVSGFASRYTRIEAEQEATKIAVRNLINENHLKELL